MEDTCQSEDSIKLENRDGDSCKDTGGVNTSSERVYNGDFVQTKRFRQTRGPRKRRLYRHGGCKHKLGP
ncbi:Arginine--tRNA ligase, partial [Clarias magur]